MNLLTHPFVLVFLGGGFGACLRYTLGVTFKRQGWTADFPWHTFTINVIGSFALGILAVVCRDRTPWLLLLGVGVCGGFTTFSAFSIEAVELIEANRWPALLAY